MITSAYIKLTDYSGKQIMGDSEVKGHEHEIVLLHWGFSAVQAINIGSQASGAGAGKVTFNPLRITKLIDKASPTLFTACCTGRPFKDAVLSLTRSVGEDSATTTFFTIDAKLAAIKSITYGEGDDPTEIIEFECGGIVLTYTPLSRDGKTGAAVTGGWNRVRNVQMSGSDSIT